MSSATTGVNSLGKDAFMNLLVTQMQHQNPLEPQADGAFLAQLAQFSSLEQLQGINDNVSKLMTFVDGIKPTATTTDSSTSSTSSTQGA
jgi:flagellar hook assembly protein FlgD